MGTAVLGAGPAGLTAAYVLALRGVPGDRLRGRRHRRRHRQDGRVQRLPLRSRRPPFLHEVRAGAAPVGGDARRRVARPAAALAHLLRREVPRVPAPGPGRRRPPRRPGVGAVLALVLSQPPFAVPPRDRDVRGLGDRRTSARGSTTSSSASYTEKVWGIPGSEIHSEWAAQRIKDFSFWKALLAALHLSAHERRRR